MQDQSSAFLQAMQGITYQWGFIIIKTTTDLSSQQWSTALSNLHTIALANKDPNADMDPSNLALPVVSLPGADIPTVRAAFTAWLRAYDEHFDGEWESDVRRDVCVVVDAEAAQSLLDSNRQQQDKTAWVLVVDAATNPSGAQRSDDDDYQGWMRCLAHALWTLSDDLDGDGGMRLLCPPRQYADQIPVFDGSSTGKVVEPAEGAVEEGSKRAEFLRGTQRAVGRLSSPSLIV